MEKISAKERAYLRMVNAKAERGIVPTTKEFAKARRIQRKIWGLKPYRRRISGVMF